MRVAEVVGEGCGCPECRKVCDGCGYWPEECRCSELDYEAVRAEVAGEIRRVMAEKRITLGELSRRLEKDKSNVLRIRKGRNMQLRSLSDLARALGVVVHIRFENEGD